MRRLAAVQPSAAHSADKAATLAGLVKAPSAYSPRRHPKRATKRRNIVLRRMLETGFIDEKQFKKSHAEQLKVRKPKRTKRTAPYFADFVKRFVNESGEINNPTGETFRIHTGLDTEYQLCAERAVKNGLKNLEKNMPVLKKNEKPIQAALISVHQNSGAIRAWVGGRNYRGSQFDRVSQAFRQPGSAFKPFVYLTALDGNLNNYRVARTTSTLMDEPMEFELHDEVWSPKNYDEEFRGEVTVRHALTKSLNVPTVYLADKVGVDKIIDTAELLGLGERLPRVHSLALGSGSVSMLALTRAYTTIASGGRLIDLRPVMSLTNAHTNSLIQKVPFTELQVASEAGVYVLTNLLQSAVEYGTGQVVRRLGFDRPAAGKTGTTSSARDAWFAGYTPTLLTIVWVGFDDYSETELTGAKAAAPIWTEYMKCVSPMEEELDFLAPPDVVFKNIDQATGQLATQYCPSRNIVTEVFVQGTEPITPCYRHSSETAHLYQRERSKERFKREREHRKQGQAWREMFGF